MSEHMLPELPPRPILPLPGLPPVGQQVDFASPGAPEAQEGPQRPLEGVGAPPRPMTLPEVRSILSEARPLPEAASSKPHETTQHTIGVREPDLLPASPPQLQSPAGVTSLQIPAVSSPLRPSSIAVGEHGSGERGQAAFPQPSTGASTGASLYDVPGVDTPLPLDAAPAIDRSGPKGSLPGPYVPSLQLPAPSQAMSGAGPRAPLTGGRFPTSPSSPTAMLPTPSVPSSTPPEAPRLPAVGGVAPEGINEKYRTNNYPALPATQAHTPKGVESDSALGVVLGVQRSNPESAPSLPSPSSAGWPGPISSYSPGPLSLPRPSSPALSPVAAGVEELETPGVQRQEGGVMGALSGQFGRMQQSLDKLVSLMESQGQRGPMGQPRGASTLQGGRIVLRHRES